MSFRQFVAFSLPTLWIYYTFSSPSLASFSLYREAFGNPDHYLDLYFESNPEGPLLAGRAVRFRGYWVQGDGEFPVRGIRVKREGRIEYQFLKNGKGYRAELLKDRASGPPGCEPKLRVHAAGMESLVLKAGFCL